MPQEDHANIDLEHMDDLFRQAEELQMADTNGENAQKMVNNSEDKA